MSGSVRILPAGRHALLVELADDRQVRAAYAVIRGLADPAGLKPPADVVPGARTVLVDGIDDVGGWRAAIEGGLDGQAGDAETPAGKDVVLTVDYDGPDLAVVAEAWECAPEDVVRQHQEMSFTVAFCGFAPGFAYCTSDPALPAVPRRDDPRTSVAAGSVGLAGAYCGIYPRAMPGGWQLIGTTSEVMFDPTRDEPALLSPGDRVRFERAT